MAGPLTAAGAVQEPSEYATLTMDRAITGLWTQRSPLRDADVPYLYGKFYSASRFDSLIDGINREITSRLTDARRPGSSVWNGQNFPAINSFYSFQYVQNGAEIVRILADGQDGNVYDATGGTKSTLFTKSAGAGKARFCTASPVLYLADGVDNHKILRSSITWSANTQFSAGNLIIDTNGNAQVVLGASAATIQTIQVIAVHTAGLLAPVSYFLKITFTANVNFPVGTSISFTGVGTYNSLNNQTLGVVADAFFLPGAPNVVYFPAIINATYGPAADTGSAIPTSIDAGIGTSGGSQPVWGNTVGAQTTDGSLTWMCFGTPSYAWQTAKPTSAPFLALNPNNRQWTPSTALSMWYSILDNNNNVEVAVSTPSGGNFVTGAQLPIWSTLIPTSTARGGQTNDNAVVWQNCGPMLAWVAATGFTVFQCVLDSNQNLQVQTSYGGTTGGSVPTWNTVIGGTTTDGTVTWTCVGPGSVVLSGALQYAYSYHCIDGSVTTASPVATLSTNTFVLGPANAYFCYVAGRITTDPQIDQVWIWRTAQGKSTLVQLAQVQNILPGFVGNNAFSFQDAVPDTSLVAQSIAPIADQGDPPPVGMTAPVFHAGRIFSIYRNTVIWSGGGDTITGNGNTSWPPGNFATVPEQPQRLFAGVTSRGNTLFIFGTSNVYAIFGDGTSSSPFSPAVRYMPSVGIKSYDAVDLVGSTFYLFTGKKKFVSLDPSGGYQEAGFPIGDQFKNVTTGAGVAATGALYNPSSTFVTWHEESSGDTAVYVADGTVGWFRFSPVASPESGYLWSPRAAILGGTSAVQSIETSTGVSQLLIGPGIAGGPILFRDSTVNTDWTTGAATAYPAYDVKGNIVLCPSGEIAELSHVALTSTAVGNRPSVSLLLGEIAPTLETPFDVLQITDSDPPAPLPASTTLYSDRYSALQNGVCPKCRHFQFKVDYGTQAAADELLEFSIYGAKHAERKQQ